MGLGLYSYPGGPRRYLSYGNPHTLLSSESIQTCGVHSDIDADARRHSLDKGQNTARGRQPSSAWFYTETQLTPQVCMLPCANGSVAAITTEPSANVWSPPPPRQCRMRPAAVY